MLAWIFNSFLLCIVEHSFQCSNHCVWSSVRLIHLPQHQWKFDCQISRIWKVCQRMTSSVAFWFYVANFCKISTLKIKQETSRTTSLSFDETNFKMLRKTKNLEKYLLPFHTFQTFGAVFTSFLKFHSLLQTCHQSTLSLVGRSLMMLHQKAGREN